MSGRGTPSDRADGSPPQGAPADDAHDEPETLHEARLWRDGDWTARVIKNEDDDGWAVEMLLRGAAEPALVGPWTMGRDKKNPKPLDAAAFHTLVKTASEVLRRHEQQRHAQLHKRVEVSGPEGRVTVTLDIVPDEDDPHGRLKAVDAFGEVLGEARVRPDFKLNGSTAQAWVDGGFAKPGGR